MLEVRQDWVGNTSNWSVHDEDGSLATFRKRADAELFVLAKKAEEALENRAPSLDWDGHIFTYENNGVCLCGVRINEASGARCPLRKPSGQFTEGPDVSWHVSLPDPFDNESGHVFNEHGRCACGAAVTEAYRSRCPLAERDAVPDHVLGSCVMCGCPTSACGDTFVCNRCR